ncbi:MAG: peptidoglycan bridge formation glycyltransferase FemA/FemB family protein [Eubacteriales bacterium]|nr:peptidoglycan bridge formation glycyltransferase FemA/FemB family protein [Eubacteriales bacterium]MDD4323619.1 peptidoglycan bridge formation glycyltransferase FemA/FemB family protein [Eubacteriales bacterium]MDD4540748.1 peptidoglycan bridge formation glycyltransferase FemA/FemB family protein [Eubacteriales bacterium]
MLLDVNNIVLTKEYDDFIARSDFGNFYQSRQWSEVKNTWKHYYFYLKDQGEICAAMSVLSISDSIAGKEFFYAPRGPVCDLHDLKTARTLIEEVKEFASKSNAFLLRIDPEVAHDDELVSQYANEGLHFSKNPALTSQPLMSLILEIKGRSAAEILWDFDKGTRYEIRSSYRKGVEPYVGGREDMEAFYKLIVEMSENKSIGHRPLDYYYRIYDSYSKTSRLHFARFEDELQAGAMLIGCNRTLTYLYGADPLHIKKNQSALIQFENITHAINAGYDFYDMGGIFSCDINDGLYQFKRKFTEDNIVHWIGNLDIVLDQEAYKKYYAYHMEHFDWSIVDVSKEEFEKTRHGGEYALICEKRNRSI